ncbi:MAG TPA: hypothetical protein VLU25_19770 [Acidobacteriota bacterium]|nr:hypothetical protein [Acidobacteriota bacterium]
MMNPLTVIGLILGIAGAWALAYPILWGYPKQNRRLVAQRQLANLEDFMADMEKQTRRLPDPPYKETEIEAFVSDFKAEWDPKKTKLENEISQLGDAHERRSFVLSILGIGLLSIGFFLQLIEAW